MFEIDKKFANDIVKWHKKAMPHATLASQLEKLDEELKELGVASEKASRDNSTAGMMMEAFEETADVLICCVVLCERFGSSIGSVVANSIASSEASIQMIIDMCMWSKMRKNKARKWKEAKPGYYKHVED